MERNWGLRIGVTLLLLLVLPFCSVVSPKVDAYTEHATTRAHAEFTPATKGISVQSLSLGLLDKMHYVIDTVSEPRTLDPAKVNVESDFAGAELIMNVYDPLIMFKGTATDSFVPWLASDYKISADGLTYEFAIRSHVPWHVSSYGFVTPADAEYSLEKILVRDYTGSSAWMFWRSIFGINSATEYGDITDPAVARALGNLIDNAITSDANSLTVRFVTEKPYQYFRAALAQACGAIQSKQWAIDLGDWNPNVDKLSDGTWVRARNPPESPLEDRPMPGSGPYIFDFWWHGTDWSVVMFNDYWGGWGESRCSSLLGTPTKTRGYLSRITEILLVSWAARYARFVGSSPGADSTYVPADHRAEVWQQPGVKCRYPLEGKAWTDRYWARDWVHGWYYNQRFFPGCYFYSMWKEDITTSTGKFAGKHVNWEDINEDGQIDIKDIAPAGKAFGGYYIDPDLPPYPVGTPGFYTPNWNSRADVNVVNIATGARGDMKVDIKDIAAMGKLFGFVADPWVPGP